MSALIALALKAADCIWLFGTHPFFFHIRSGGGSVFNSETAVLSSNSYDGTDSALSILSKNGSRWVQKAAFTSHGPYQLGWGMSLGESTFVAGAPGEMFFALDAEFLVVVHS